jgi:DNA-binding transcriptional MerR regulator
MDAGALTIHEAAATSGWSPRMLRYIEESGLVVPERSASGYRLFGPAELQRLRTLRELLDGFGVELAEMGFARRLREDPGLRHAVDAWFAALPVRPPGVSPPDWLAYEQEKHLQLLALAGSAAGAGFQEEK